MRTLLRVCLVVALFALTAAAALAVPVQLEYRYVPGDVDEYKFSMTMTISIAGMPAKAGMSNMKMSLTMPYTQRVLEVYEDGSAKIKTAYGTPSITGASIPARNFRRAAAKAATMPVMTISKRGQLLTFGGTEKLAESSPLDDLDFNALLNCTSGQALLPDEPVEVGQTWDQNISLPLGNSWLGVTSTLVSGDEVFGQYRAARIRQTMMGGIDLGAVFKSIVQGIDAKGQMPFDMSSMMGALDLDGTMTYLFATTAGKLLKGSGNMKAGMDISMPPELVKQGAPRTLSIRMNMGLNIVRVK